MKRFNQLVVALQRRQTCTGVRVTRENGRRKSEDGKRIREIKKRLFGNFVDFAIFLGFFTSIFLI